MKKLNSLLIFVLAFSSIISLTALSVSAAKKIKLKKPFLTWTDGEIIEVDVSGTVIGVANQVDRLFYTHDNLAHVFASSYSSLPCPGGYNRNTCFQFQIPADWCDGNQHNVKVFANANMTIGYELPIASQSYICYRADSPDKIPAKTPVIFIPGIGGSVLAERNADGTETSLYPDRVVTGIGLERLDISLNANIIATDAVREAPVVGNVYKTFIESYLVGQGEYKEYNVSGIPERRRIDGC